VSDLGKTLIVVGLLLVGAGALLLLTGSRGWHWIGRLPGDITFRWSGGAFYFPLATCIVLSVVLSLVLAFFRR
jgi:Holliday junction DNA helicase RuvB